MDSVRINTGPYKPENDWTGYFVRGDRALGEAALFQYMAERLEQLDAKMLSNSDHAAVMNAAKLFGEWAEEFSRVYEGSE